MNSVEDQWETDPFDDGSSRLVGQKHILAMSLINSQYTDELKKMWSSLLSIPRKYGGKNSLKNHSLDDPISFSLDAFEQTNVIDLVKTDNKVFNKITQVFGFLGLEIDELIEQCRKKFYPSLSLFGVPVSEDDKKDVFSDFDHDKMVSPPQIHEDIESYEGECQIWLGRMWSMLISLSNYVNRCYHVVSNLIRQLSSLYHGNQKLYQQSYRKVHLSSIYQKLFRLLNVLITLDHIIYDNDRLPSCWSMYKRMLLTIRKDPSKYNVDEEMTWRFEKLMHELKGLLMGNMIYTNCVEQEFDDPSLYQVRANMVFKEEFFFNLKAMCDQLESLNPQNDPFEYGEQYMGVCSLFGMYMNIWRPEEESSKRLFKTLWGLYRTTPIIHLYSLSSFDPAEFLMKHVPPSYLKLVKTNNLKTLLNAYVHLSDNEFNQRSKIIYVLTCKWISKMQNEQFDFDKNNVEKKSSNTSQIMSVILQGLRLSSSANYLAQSILSLHSKTQISLKSTMISEIFECLHIVKTIHYMYKKNAPFIARVIQYQQKDIKSSLTQILVPLKQKLLKSRLNEGQLDQLAATTLVLDMLQGPFTNIRSLLISLGFHQIGMREYFKDQEPFIQSLLARITQIANFENYVRRNCDTSFIYWYRDIVPIYFKYIMNHPQDAFKLPVTFNVLFDVTSSIYCVIHESVTSFRNAYKREIYKALSENILIPLCHEIEKDLRLHVHSQYYESVNHLDPFKNGLTNISPLLQLEPLKIDSFEIDIKEYVSHYLDTSFYNVNTVALYDWQTYSEMRNLAKVKYNLDLKEVHLPGQTFEQGLDVLEIMRNIQTFVRDYNYNINNQVFIEKASNNKTLNTINIQHVSNSIRTHGTGIMNTTVNFTYQFLKQKFIIFSQFLYDDIIKSSLFREIRFFNENKETLDNRYPYERAEKLVREIKNKVGKTKEGVSYLDKFRVLITEIGNAMGYVRMIRSGGLLHTSNSIQFLPHLDDPVKFSELMKDRNDLSEETIAAATNLDAVVGGLTHHFAEGTDYFKMFVSVFQKEFRSEENIHLKNFYVMVPALTVSFIDSIISSKEKLGKKGSKDGAFTDDGFAIGISYILKLLDLNVEFDSLHWFDSVSAKLSEEQKGVTKSKEKKGDPMLSKLTQKKITSLTSEFQLLRFSFAGSRIFFYD